MTTPFENPTAPERVAETVTYAGAAATAVLWGLSAHEWTILGTGLVTILSFAAHIWFASRRDRREEKLLNAKLRALTQEPTE